jgi:hypothetical protein
MHKKMDSHRGARRLIEICGNSRARWEDGLAAVEDLSHANAVLAIPARPHRNKMAGRKKRNKPLLADDLGSVGERCQHLSAGQTVLVHHLIDGHAAAHRAHHQENKRRFSHVVADFAVKKAT